MSRDKLIEAKQRWARDGRLLTGTVGDPERDRLPPGQRLVRDWPVLDLGAEPNVTPQKFRLDVDGAVENRPKPETRHVVFHSFDGYTANLRLEQFDQPDVFLVHEWEGKPLSGAHGGPVRMLIPRLYFWKSAKWLRRIQFTISDHPGFWEQRGYHNNGDPWQEERYD
jgi:DMSO/TMAO reductase YedYZ molybdopterin-dependent catalytic subunit